MLTQTAAPVAADYPGACSRCSAGKYSFDVTEPATDLCPRRLCPDEASDRLPTGRRLRELGSDLSLVSLHLLLPDDLRDDLPPVDRSFGNFRQLAGGDASAPDGTDGATGRGFEAIAALAERVSHFHRFNRGLVGGPARARLSFLMFSSPTTPTTSCPADSAIQSRSGRRPA